MTTEKEISDILANNTQHRQATPKTLTEAIHNGLIASWTLQEGRGDVKLIAEGIRAHVIDFMAQQLNVALFTETGDPRAVALVISDLWRRIKKK